MRQPAHMPFVTDKRYYLLRGPWWFHGCRFVSFGHSPIGDTIVCHIISQLKHAQPEIT